MPEHDTFYVISGDPEKRGKVIVTVLHEVPSDAEELGSFTDPGAAIDFAQQEVRRLNAMVWLLSTWTLLMIWSEQADMPITVFDVKGIPATRRERIETAVVAGGAHTVVPYEAWIARPVPRRFQSAHYRPHGFERTALFATNDEPATIKDRIPTGRTKASRKWQRMQLLIAACLRVASGCVRLRKKRENFS